jgi:hypothetical protein
MNTPEEIRDGYNCMIDNIKNLKSDSDISWKQKTADDVRRDYDSMVDSIRTFNNDRQIVEWIRHLKDQLFKSTNSQNPHFVRINKNNPNYESLKRHFSNEGFIVDGETNP